MPTETSAPAGGSDPSTPPAIRGTISATGAYAPPFVRTVLFGRSSLQPTGLVGLIKTMPNSKIHAIAENTAAAQPQETQAQNQTPNDVKDDSVRAREIRRFNPKLMVPSIESIERWEALAACGFPSPALEYAHEQLNLNDFFLNHPSATFAITARGDSMVDYGIYDGDTLFVDRAAEPRTGDVVLAFVDGSFTVKELDLTDKVPKLRPHNAQENYPVIIPQDLETFSIEGVVVSLGRRFSRRPSYARESRFED